MDEGRAGEVSDYRIPLKLEDTTDDLGNQYTQISLHGQPFAVLMWEITRDEPQYVYSLYDCPSDRWSLRFYLKEIRPAPKPEPLKRKRKQTDLGLRRPK